MIAAGLALAAVAGLLHVYIFWLESIVWTSARARATFGTTEADAHTTRALAFNQGFYNLFLAIEILLGIALYGAGRDAVGLTLVCVGAGSMVAAAAVLVASQRSKARAAAIQAGPAVAALGLLAWGLLSAS